LNGLLFFLEAFGVAGGDTGEGRRVGFLAADAVGCRFRFGGLFLLLTLSLADLAGTLIRVVLNAVLVERDGEEAQDALVPLQAEFVSVKESSVRSGVFNAVVDTVTKTISQPSVRRFSTYA